MKFIIQGLTSLSNLFLSNKALPDRVYQKAELTPVEVLNGVIGDFENGYLFSGQIDSEIYDEDCVFTDPTLSFKGLSTFERNIKALKPALDVFVGDSLVVLYDCKIDQEIKEIKAVWRMSGAVNLPWGPRIELTGNTVLTYDTDRGGRIVDYYERWDLPAATALLQLLQPSKSLLSYNVPLQGTKNILLPVEDATKNSRAAAETINVKKLKSTILSSVIDISAGERTARTGVIADAVRSLIRASSKEALAPGSIGGSGSTQITGEQAATYALLDVQNSLSFYEILYSNVNTADDSDPLEKFITNFRRTLPETQFTDLGSSEGIFKSRSTLGPFSIEVVSSCAQPNIEKATLLISKKKLKVRISFFSFHFFFLFYHLF